MSAARMALFPVRACYCVPNICLFACIGVFAACLPAKAAIVPSN